jgi:hypothetical protein
MLSLNPAAKGQWPAGPITLKNPTLRISGKSIDLGTLQLGDRGLVVDLANYTINGTPVSSGLNSEDAGTLTITITGADNLPATMTSVVQVLRDSGS